MKINFPKNRQYLSKEDDEKWGNYRKSILQIENDFHVTTTNLPYLSDFYLYSKKKKVKTLCGWQVFRNRNSFKLIAISYDSYQEYNTPYIGSNNLINDAYLVGVVSSPIDLGHIIIRHETILDKIAELFNHVEIDFPDHILFSFKYYVVADDKEKTLKVLNQDLMDFFCGFSDIEAEFFNKQIFFRFSKSINDIDALKICEAGTKLDEILKRHEMANVEINDELS